MPTPFLPMGVKFGVLEQTHGLHLHTKFHLNVFIVSASGGQKPQFWANLDFGWLVCLPPFTDEGQIWHMAVMRQNHPLRENFQNSSIKVQ